MALALDNRQMVGIQNNHQRAREVNERRYALPAFMISSKRASFLNLPASRVHHGCLDVFRTAFNSDLISRSSRSRTVTRCSNFLAVDGMFYLSLGKNTLNASRRKATAARRRRHHQRRGGDLHAERREEDSEGHRSSHRKWLSCESRELSA